MNSQAYETAPSDRLSSGNEQIESAHWGGILAMSLCVFTLIASEFMPVSLLTPIANDLNVNEGLVGYGIAISGAFAVLTSLWVSSLTRAMNRKTLVLLLTSLMGVSGLIMGFASSYIIYMVGRALIGVVVGGFWSISAATAMRLVPSRSVPKALAIFNGGNALAMVVAAPLGSYLGAVIGWRGAFLCLVPLALIALLWQWVSLPSLAAQPRTPESGNIFRLFKSRLVTLGMLAIGIFFMGQFVLFTYIRPFLETATQVNVSTLSMILLTMGVAGLIGTSFIGLLLKTDIYRTLIIIPLLMAVIAFALIVFGSSVFAAFILLAAWGLVATAAPVGWWSWLAKSLPGNAEAGGGLMVAVVQLCIAIGSTIGGILFDSSGYPVTFAASAALLLIASVLALYTARAERVD